MDRLWVRVVMEFWVRMAWCWEGEVEGVVIALLEVSLVLPGSRSGGGLADWI